MNKQLPDIGYNNSPKKFVDHLARSCSTKVEGMVQRILEDFRGPAVIVDTNGLINYGNKHILSLTDGTSQNLSGKEFALLCLPAESQDEIRNIFAMMRQGLPVAGNVLCKLKTSQAEYLIDWQITPLWNDRLKLVTLLGYNIEDYRPMFDFNSIVSPFPSTGIFIVQNGRFKFWNDHISYYSGRKEAEMIDCDYDKIVHPEDITLVRDNAAKMLRGQSKEPYEYRYINKNGETRWAMEAVVPVVYGGGRAVLGYVVDITEEKKMRENLRESENIYRTIFENSGTAMIMYSDDYLITMANKEVELLSGYSRLETENKMKWTDFVTKKGLPGMTGYHELKMLDGHGSAGNYEFDLVRKDGMVRNIYMTVSVIPGTNIRLASMMDVTSRRQAEDKLRFLSTHDGLTGLYNRAFFQDRMEKLQSTDRFGLIACDIDGLKLINDTFGHAAGDKALLAMGRILAQCAREDDVVARTGGDEYAILLAGNGYADAICAAIRRSVDQYNSEHSDFPLSISLGSAVTEDGQNNPYDLFRLADNNMYREKMLHSHSVRNSIVQIAMKALGERDFVTEGHAERLCRIVEKMLAACGPDKCNPSDVLLLAEFHDIGKVGIPDRVLFKKGPLTHKEYSEMQRHCEIGQRIALSSPELAPIADWILKHHERWDGNGYPLHLKGEQIPLACRILALADSYDAMVSDRPYRKAVTHAYALAEIVRCAGSQFDPDLVRVFVRLFEDGLLKPPSLT